MPRRSFLTSPLGMVVLFGSSGSAPVVDPEITVTGNGQSIADGDNTPTSGDHTDFGLSATLSTITRTFNIAVAAANLTGVSVALSGAGAAGFTITDQPDATINSGANSDFSIRYDALSYISYTATVTISSNELDDFTFDIKGSSIYSARMLATSGLQRYNPMNEGSGTTLVDSGASAFTGTYTGITWDAAASPVSEAAPNFDGTNDVANLHSAAFATAFGFDEGFLLIWLKVQAGTVWTDGTGRTIASIRRDANNRILISKTSTNNQMSFTRVANGTSQTVTASGFNETGWISIALSYSVSGNALMAFKNGVQVGTTQTGLVASAGSGLSSTQTVLGSNNTTPATVWNGNMAQFALFTTAQNAAKLALMTV